MRIQPDTTYEQALWSGGITLIAGVDEAGRGAWAGPVAAGAVILPRRLDLAECLPGVRDSKQMTALQRTRWAEKIRALACAWGVGFSSADEIDALGILPATRLAMQRAIEQLLPAPQHLLVDAVRLPEVDLPQQALIKGDVRVLSIAAASVLAKTARDALMIELDASYPGYSLARHKGYGTAAHRVAVQSLGPCVIHRRSYAPIRALNLTSSPTPSPLHSVERERSQESG
jgi:ribonuclease HII